MKIEIEHISIIYPNEESGRDKKMVLEDDHELLQFNFYDYHVNEEPPGGMALNKKQVVILRDALNMFLKNKLIE